MRHTDIRAHQTMQAPRATIGRHALNPSRLSRPAPARRAPWRLMLALAACALLVACGGGSEDGRADIQCNPDSFDCASLYGHLYAFRAVPDTAQGSDIYTNDPAPRAGYVIVSN